MLLYLLYPLEADAGWADDEGGPWLDLLPLHPAVRAHVLAPEHTANVSFINKNNHIHTSTTTADLLMVLSMANDQIHSTQPKRQPDTKVRCINSKRFQIEICKSCQSITEPRNLKLFLNSFHCPNKRWNKNYLKKSETTVTAVIFHYLKIFYNLSTYPPAVLSDNDIHNLQICNIMPDENFYRS